MAGTLSPEQAYDVVARVVDPELPAVTIAELGILRDVRMDSEGTGVDVDITPTYSGCPALEAIRADVEAALHTAGAAAVRVHTVLTPAWSTDLISAEGRRKLAEAGVAPPPPGRDVPREGPVLVDLLVRCPHCGSLDTREVSRFGPTPCTALHTCAACLEPFEHVKRL